MWGQVPTPESRHTRPVNTVELTIRVPVSTLLSIPVSAPNPLYRGELPRGAWIGLGVGVLCSMGAICAQYALGVATIPETARNLGIVFAILGLSLGGMGAVRGLSRARSS